MIVKDGAELYPLNISRVERDGEVYYDRNTRGKSWFVLDFWTRYSFAPRGSSGLVTADGKEFITSQRTGGRIPY